MAAKDIRTIDSNGKKVPGNFDSPPAGVRGEVRSITRDFDCSVENLLAANTYDIMTVGDNLIPLNFITSFTTAEGAGDTLDIGDEDSVTRFETAISTNTTAVTQTMDADIEYTSEKKIRIQPSADLATCVFSITMVFMYR